MDAPGQVTTAPPTQGKPVFTKFGQDRLWDRTVGQFADVPSRSPRSATVRLFLVSCTTLFLEIMLIRWISTEIRIFAYFQNLALIACFLGFGLGCYWSDRAKSLLLSVVAMIGILFLANLPVPGWGVFLEAVSTRLALSSDAAIWGFPSAYLHLKAWTLTTLSVVVVAAFLLLLMAAMIPLGQWVGFIWITRKTWFALTQSICWEASSASG